MQPKNFDLDVLRTFVTGVELGSFAKAADRLGRSTSAASLHLRRLEDQAGRPLLRKQGRGLVPTDMGEMLLGYARRLLALNDEAMEAIREEAVVGAVRLGLPQDFAEGVLPPILARFTAAHRLTTMEASGQRRRLPPAVPHSVPLLVENGPPRQNTASRTTGITVDPDRSASLEVRHS